LGKPTDRVIDSPIQEFFSPRREIFTALALRPRFQPLESARALLYE